MRPFQLAGLAATATLAILTGCMVGPDYQRPTVAFPAAYKELPPAPTGWKIAAPSDGVDRGKWWSIYDDPLLDRLEAQVDIGNQNLKAYEAAYRQALDLVDEARSGLFPTLSSGGRVGTGQSLTSNIGKTRGTGFRVSWDLDVWGRIRRQIESGRAAAQASAAELAAVRLSAQAELATDYFQLRYDDSLARLLRETATFYRQTLKITRSQHAAGSADGSDVLNAETQLETAEARLVAVGSSRARYEHAIALLTGQPPAGFSIPYAEMTATVPDIPVTVPSALLERRPDVAQAERTMQQENARIGMTQAAYYPDISLSALIAYAKAGSFPLSNPLWALGAQGTELLLDGGNRAATVAAARGAYDQSVATYRQTVLTAFRDVEDALSSINVLGRQSEVHARAVLSSQRAVALALAEYRAQSQTYTTVTAAQIAELSNEQGELQIKENQLTESVALLKALGGGWSNDHKR